jgi:hypothetical protein
MEIVCKESLRTNAYAGRGQRLGAPQVLADEPEAIRKTERYALAWRAEPLPMMIRESARTNNGQRYPAEEATFVSHRNGSSPQTIAYTGRDARG